MASRRPTRIAARPSARTFDQIDAAAQREQVLRRPVDREDRASTTARRCAAFWSTLYQTVQEGMFADPIYGGNRNKAGWKMLGFPGAIAVHREHVVQYRDKPFPQ